jgi:hypothetical protein
MFGLKDIVNIMSEPQDKIISVSGSSVVSNAANDQLDKKKTSVASQSWENLDALSPSSWTQASTSVPSTVLLTDRDSGSEVNDDGGLLEDSNHTMELEKLRLELAASHQARRNLEKELDGIKVENAASHAEIDASQAKQTKMRDNLKNKRVLLCKAQQDKVLLETQLTGEQSKLGMATDETDSLRVSLQSVMASREDLKQKLKSQKEALKVAKFDQDALERKLSKVEKMHLVENDLLDHYRKLSLHTGYFKWGKPIRNLEDDLAAKLMAAAAVAAGNGDHY